MVLVASAGENSYSRKLSPFDDQLFCFGVQMCPAQELRLHDVRHATTKGAPVVDLRVLENNWYTVSSRFSPKSYYFGLEVQNQNKAPETPLSIGYFRPIKCGYVLRLYLDTNEEKEHSRLVQPVRNGASLQIHPVPSIKTSEIHRMWHFFFQNAFSRRLSPPSLVGYGQPEDLVYLMQKVRAPTQVASASNHGTLTIDFSPVYLQFTKPQRPIPVCFFLKCNPDALSTNNSPHFYTPIWV